MTIKISAVICTHNRAGYLEKAIKSLVEQTLPRDQYEIIVVDNGSTDATKTIVQQFLCHQSPVTSHQNEQVTWCRGDLVSYIYEPILGLSQARNTGWQNAKGEYVAYLDDDAIAAPDWLQKILETFDSVKPQPGVVGGKVEPIWEAPRPAWLPDGLLGQLTVLDWGAEPIVLRKDQWFVGANMAFPKKVLKEIGGFKTRLGRKGGNLLSMEENLARLEIEKRGLQCFYLPAARACHHVVPERLTKKWFLDRAYWNGVSSAVVQEYVKPTPFLSRFLKGLTTLLRILFSPRDIQCLIAGGDSPGIFQKKCSVYARLGHLRWLFGVAK